MRGSKIRRNGKGEERLLAGELVIDVLLRLHPYEPLGGVLGLLLSTL